MIEEVLRYIKGYVILELYGDSVERFLNLCKNKGIGLNQLFIVNNSCFLKMSCKDFLKIRGLLKKTGCTCRIKEKRGLFVLAKKMKARKGLVIGGILFLFILYQCFGRIWSISVEGGFLHTGESILCTMAEELGIYGGISAGQIDCFEIEKKIRLDYKDIGWVSVEKKGCRLNVMLNECTMPDRNIKQDTASHIVAAYDGFVRKIEVMSGIPLVKQGDKVKKGDVLISGIIPMKGDYDEIIEKKPVGAEGKVFIESEFSYEAGYPMIYEQKKYKKGYYGIELFLFGYKIFSDIPRYSEGKYDIMCIDIVPFCFENYSVPVLLKKYRLLPYNSKLTNITEKNMEEKIKADWNAFLCDWEHQGVQILRAEYATDILHKKCFVTGTITACGNFISYQKILEEEWIIQDEYSGNNS